jgi:hypothetical protein
LITSIIGAHSLSIRKAECLATSSQTFPQKAVMASAAEAELVALYLNTKEAVYLRQILIEMGHPQLQTPIQTDPTMAEGVTKKKYSQNAPKQWICDSIGSATASPKTNSKYIGNQGRQIWRIIL